MKNLICSFFFLLVFSISYTQDTSFVLKHVNVIDMRNNRIKEDMTVVIKGNKIASVSKNVKITKGSKLIDAKGKFLIPGLWDMHVHIRNLENIFFPLFIANGVTGIREMHYLGKCYTIGKWKDSVATGQLPSPRIGAAAGCAIDEPGDQRGFGVIEVSNEEQARKAVRLLKQGGADFIKVYVRLTPTTYQAIADEAKILNLPFAGHIPYSMSAVKCAEWGQKSFEHMIDFHKYCSTEEASLLKSYSDSLNRLTPAYSLQLLKRAFETYDYKKAISLSSALKKNGTWVCPTIYWYNVAHNRIYLSEEGRRRAMDVPVAVKEKWEPKNLTPMNRSDSIAHAQLFERELTMLKTLYTTGVRMIAGTDASPVRNVIPGFSLHDELALYVRAGFSPYNALRTATINAALFLGRDHELGTIEKGKLADLVLLDANPLEDIRNTQKINAVIINGRLLNRTTLNQLLNNADENAKQQN
jgi:hypothetical protein